MDLDDIDDLLRLDFTLAACDFVQMLNVNLRLAVAVVGERQVGEERLLGRGGQMGQAVLERLPDDVLSFKQEDFLMSARGSSNSPIRPQIESALPREHR